MDEEVRVRFFRYGELPLVLLALLQRASLNGYELMTELGRLFRPHYQPSAGSVYPALNALETERLIHPVGNESPKRYEITKVGAGALEERRYQLAEIEARTGVRVRADDTVDTELDRLTEAVRLASGQVDAEDIAKVLRRADKQVRALTEGKGGKR